MVSVEEAKALAARKAAELIEEKYYKLKSSSNEEIVLGIGTGSTAMEVLKNLTFQKTRQLIPAIPTSHQALQAILDHKQLRPSTLAEFPCIDILFDGADEVCLCRDGEVGGNNLFPMIKGGGGALFQEKIIAEASKYRLYIVDYSKLSRFFGRFRVPVEISPFAFASVRSHLEEEGLQLVLRESKTGKVGPVISDNGNFIADFTLPSDLSPDSLAKFLDSISGIIEHGFFMNHADVLVVGEETGKVSVHIVNT